MAYENIPKNSDNSAVQVTPLIVSPPVNQYAHKATGVSSTLAVATTGSGLERTITIADASSFSVGNELHLFNGSADATFPTILSIASNVLTLDRYIDSAHAIGTEVKEITTNIAVLGSLASPIIYDVHPRVGESFEITRLILTLTHNTAGDLGLFGNLASLTNGTIIRVKVSGAYVTFTNWKSNADIKDDMYDVEFDTRSGGGGTYGTSGRGTFTELGLAVNLDGAMADELQVIVQDDLSSLASFRIKAQGHFR